jgi:hypothetical protein
MKLLSLAICLLCCGSAGAQTKPPTFQESCSWVSGGRLVCSDEHGKHIDITPGGDPCSEEPKIKPAGAKQLICDWQTDHWYCPTREPISNTNGKLLPELMIIRGAR